MPVWTVCLWMPLSPKQKQMWLVKWSNVTLLVNNLYRDSSERKITQGEVLNLSTSITSLLSSSPSFSWGSGSATTCCSVSVTVASLVKGRWGCCSRGDRFDWPHLASSCFGVTWANTGQALATIAAERGLAVRPLWTVSQPSASFLPNEHMRYYISKENTQATVWLESLANQKSMTIQRARIWW